MSESEQAGWLGEPDDYEGAPELALAFDSELDEMLAARILGAPPLATENTLNQLQALDAVAAENGMILAFRVCEESGELEPVFMHVLRAEGDGSDDAALIAISDKHGLLLDRYVVARGRLADALDQAEDVEDEGAEPTVVPPDWQRV